MRTKDLREEEVVVVEGTEAATNVAKKAICQENVQILILKEEATEAEEEEAEVAVFVIAATRKVTLQESVLMSKMKGLSPTRDREETLAQREETRVRTMETIMVVVVMLDGQVGVISGQ
jgi:hypothetical protein